MKGYLILGIANRKNSLEHIDLYTYVHIEYKDTYAGVRQEGRRFEFRTKNARWMCFFGREKVPQLERYRTDAVG